MVRRFLLLVPASVLLALPALPLHSEQPVCDEETCELPPPSPHEHEEPRAEEEDDIGLELALEVEYALWLHLLRVMEREGGVLVLPELRGRDLVPIWTQLPVQTASGTFEVAVEMTAVSMLPSDFQSASEAGYPPALVPRAPEITNLARAARRGPDSWQITYELREEGDGYRVTGWRVSGRPGDRRPGIPWPSTDYD